MFPVLPVWTFYLFKNSAYTWPLLRGGQKIKDEHIKHISVYIYLNTLVRLGRHWEAEYSVQNTKHGQLNHTIFKLSVPKNITLLFYTKTKSGSLISLRTTGCLSEHTSTISSRRFGWARRAPKCSILYQNNSHLLYFKRIFKFDWTVTKSLTLHVFILVFHV